uniref:Tantalus-like domain-containing protein n=1 Tax=Amphiprion percula TaxID=161767 RepID=A0A3P8RMS7_AMPPE
MTPSPPSVFSPPVALSVRPPPPSISPSSSSHCSPPLPASLHPLIPSMLSPPCAPSPSSFISPSLFSSAPPLHPPSVFLTPSTSVPSSHVSSAPLSASLHRPSISMLSPCPASSPAAPPSSVHLSPLFPSAPLPPHHFPSPPPPVSSPPSVFFTPPTCQILSTSSPPVAPPLFAPPPPAPCCPCSALLPRLLSAHRLEVRRLLRGAVASLGRRLDALERRSRSRKWRPTESSSHHNCSHAHLQHSSPDSEVAMPPLSSTQSQQRRKRRRTHRGGEFTENREEEGGRFVGRMEFSFRGGGQEELLTLHSYTQKKRRRREEGGASQSTKTISVIMRKNGCSWPRPSSQHAVHILPSSRCGLTFSQSGAFMISADQWCFSGWDPPFSLSSNHSASRLRLRSSSSFNSAHMLRLSAVTMEKMLESMRGQACWRPLRPLRDWTAPPSLSNDHCYIRAASSSSAFSVRRQQKQRANHSAQSFRLLRRRTPPLPACSASGLPVALPVVRSAAGSGFLSTNGERSKRVSQIRIRRASPRETLLTPMGLPKVKRLKKKEFSLEEIYTNKNYRSPSPNRSLETIFEEPREKDGALLLIGQQRRRRLLLFPDFTQPRKRKRPQGVGLPVAMAPRKRAAARRHCHGDTDDVDLDVMLVERLSALEDFLMRQGLEV